MADNLTLPASAQVVATDDIGGVNYQRVKISHGVDGVAVDASGTDPLPVTLSAIRATDTPYTLGDVVGDIFFA